MSSSRTEEAVTHLKSIKPYDGWSSESYVSSSGETKVQLRRRNIAVSDVGFRELVWDQPGTGYIVGITDYIGSKDDGVSSKHGRGLILVEKDGTVCRKRREIRLILPEDKKKKTGGVKVNVNDARDQIRSDVDRARRNRGVDTTEGNNRTGAVSDQENLRILQYGGCIVLGLMLIRIMNALLLLALPALFIYAVQTCPPNESFDAKKYLKRALRGEHLPEGHEKKPKGWLNETIARVGASVGTELATALEGYQVDLTNFMGACTLASVRVPASNLDCFWIGAFGKWWYVYSREIPP